MKHIIDEFGETIILGVLGMVFIGAFLAILFIVS